MTFNRTHCRRCSRPNIGQSSCTTPNRKVLSFESLEPRTLLATISVSTTSTFGTFDVEIDNRAHWTFPQPTATASLENVPALQGASGQVTFEVNGVTGARHWLDVWVFHLPDVTYTINGIEPTVVSCPNGTPIVFCRLFKTMRVDIQSGQSVIVAFEAHSNEEFYPDIFIETLLFPAEIRVYYFDYDNGITPADDFLSFGVDFQGPFRPYDFRLWWSETEELDVTRRWAASSSVHVTDYEEVIFPLDQLYASPETVRTPYLILEANWDNAVPVEHALLTTDYLKIEPDVIIDPTTNWNTVDGGITIEYEFRYRYFLPESHAMSQDERLPVRLEWAETGQAAINEDIRLDFLATSMHVSPNLFRTPSADEGTLSVTLGPSSAEDDINNNQTEFSLINTIPDVIRVTLPVTERKEPYDVSYYIKNQAPIPIEYRHTWFEQVPTIPVVIDTETGLPADRQANREIIRVLEFGHDPIGDGSDGSSYVLTLNDTDGKGQFNRTWDWIPPLEPPNVAKLLQGTVNGLVGMKNKQIAQPLPQADARELGRTAEELRSASPAQQLQIVNKFLGQLTQFLKLADAFENPSPMIPEVDINYSLRAAALTSVSGVGSIDESVKLVVPGGRRDDLRNSQNHAGKATFALSTSKALIATALASGGVAGAVFAPVLGANMIAAHFELEKSKTFYKQALDPPDPNFRELPVPREPDFEIPEGVPAVLGELLKLSARISALNGAMATARDRALGAIQAGDEIWEARQLESISEFAHQASILQGRALVGHSFYARWLSSLTGDPIPPEVFAEQAAEIAQTNGVSIEGFQEILRALTDAGDDFDALPRDAATSRGMISIDTAMLSAYAVNDLISAARIRTADLGEEITQIDDGVRQELVDRQAQILTGLAGGVVNTGLYNMISEYLQSVRQLVGDTNNVSELQPFLEFGYSSLVTFSRLAVSPSDVAGVIGWFVEEGKLSATTAEELWMTLDTAEALNSDGLLDEAIELLGSFQVSNSADQEVVELIQSYQEFVRDSGRVALAADIDGDGMVGLSDFNIIKVHFGIANALREQGDINGDGLVDLRDFGILKDAFGASASSYRTAGLGVSDRSALASVAAVDVVMAEM